ncbi:hypothetical protein K8S19_05880 [bacterium]|nr:hypothetical protein [bacterium]
MPTGMVEVVLFPRVCQAHGHKRLNKGSYVVEGVVENDHGGLTVTAERVDHIMLMNDLEKKG